jgi:hypothetical protein
MAIRRDERQGSLWTIRAVTAPFQSASLKTVLYRLILYPIEESVILEEGA